MIRVLSIFLFTLCFTAASAQANTGFATLNVQGSALTKDWLKAANLVAKGRPWKGSITGQVNGSAAQLEFDRRAWTIQGLLNGKK